MPSARTAPRSASFLRSFLDWLAPQETKSSPRETAPAPAPRQMQIGIGAQVVSYELSRGRRKTVGLMVSRKGLIVRAPLKISQREINEILLERGAWITQRLEEWRARTHLIAGDFQNNGSVLFRGKRMKLRVVASLFDSLEVSDDTIVIASSKPLSSEMRQRLVERWMRETAQAEFAPKVRAMAEAIGVEVKRVKLTDTTTMWGSCTSDGVVRLTFRLIQLPPALADYVIAHEISHRREMNHSPRFWEWVRALDPHFKTHRRTLAAYTPLLEEGDALAA